MPALAQSTDVRFPTPVASHEIVGSIAARDIGDARLTDHFYTFNGLPGDLLITVESSNLNGDFDVFTAAELRPVLKVVVYAESSSSVTKIVYLRRQESLILRVEGRTPNDDGGTYRIRFSGTFAPVENSLIAESQRPDDNNAKAARSGDRKTTRVTSSGARIYEPPEEVAVAPAPEPTPVPNVEEAAPPVKKATPARNTRPRRPVVRKPAPKPSDSEATAGAVTRKNSGSEDSTPPKNGETATVPTATATEPSRTSGRRTTTRPTRGSARAPKPRPTVETGQLVIEVNDGTKLQYPMNTVAKVTIENGEVVIVIDDGYTKRVPLTTILRMSIAP